MKYHTLTKVIFAITGIALTRAQCLKSFDLATTQCSYEALVSALQEKLNTSGCATKDAENELEIYLGSNKKEEVSEACASADIPFSSITDKGSIFDKEYFDGGTYYNEERESINEYGIRNDHLKDDPGGRIKHIFHQLARTKGISWPDHLSNFEAGNCELNAAMCCFTQDRQAGDGNGNCAIPYDENCVDADPGDNTDVCYVDMERAPTSSRTRHGFAIFDKNAEEDSHCHGFAWAEDVSDSSSRFKGNNLFFVSMYDHFTQRGYVRNVPGAPMCACIEQMPVVTRSDCTEIQVENESAMFSFTPETGLKATITDLDIQFQSCQGANNKNNDLKAYYERLVNESKISPSKQKTFEATVVGNTFCPEAISDFLDQHDLAPKPKCKFGNSQDCGCKEVLQKDYRGNKNTTPTGRTCQRWDTQAPHTHSRTRKNYPDSNLVENYCRNPDNEPGGAWCYTTDPNKRWEYCGVPMCGEPKPANIEEPAPEPECEFGNPQDCGCKEVLQKDYRGNKNTTPTGRTCQRWDTQAPHTHSRTHENYPDSNLVENYCRNPDNEPGGAWCYTTDPNKRWEYCGVPMCGEPGRLRKNRK